MNFIIRFLLFILKDIISSILDGGREFLVSELRPFLIFLLSSHILHRQSTQRKSWQWIVMVISLQFLFCFMKLADLYRWTYVSWCVIDLIASKNWRKRLRLFGSFRFFVYRSPEASIYMNRIFICIHVHGWTYTRTRTNKFIRTNRHFIFFCFQINCLFLMVISRLIFK